MKTKLIALALAFAPALAHAAPEVVTFLQCGNKVASMYHEADAIFINDEKADGISYEPMITGGIKAHFRLYAEQGGSYTQYDLTTDESNKKTTLSSQWMNADDKPLRAVDVVECTAAAQFKREAPTTQSTLEYLKSLQES